MLKKLILCAVIVMPLLSVSELSAQVEVHGFVQSRAIVSSGEGATPSSNTFRIDRFSMQFKEKINEDIDILSEVYIHPFRAATSTGAFDAGHLYLETAYINWNLKKYVGWDFTVRFGKGRNFCYGVTPAYTNRRTSDYSLYNETFNQQRDIGVQTFSKFGKVNLNLAILNGFVPGKKRFFPDEPIGGRIQIPLMDVEPLTNTNRRLAFSGRLGYKNDILNVGGSAYITQTGNQEKNVQNRFGLDGELKLPCGFLVQGEYTMAQTAVDATDKTATRSELDHMGAQILAGWEKNKVGIYGRYGMVSYDDELQGLNQIMLSTVYKIHPRIHLRLEGLINGEETDKKLGWSDVDNNVLFFETLFAW